MVNILLVVVPVIIALGFVWSAVMPLFNVVAAVMLAIIRPIVGIMLGNAQRNK